MIRFFIIQFAIFGLTVNAQAGDQLSGKVAVAPTQKIELFDGQSFSGWVFVSKDTSAPADAAWFVVDGVIVCQGKPNGYARTVQAYHDYQLHVEWRFPVGPGNSGVFLHINAPDKVWPSCLEVQLLSDKAGDIRCNGGSLVQKLTADTPKAVPHRQPSSEKPVGEWNTCDIVCRGNRVMIRVNGVLQNEVTGSSVASGAVGLQSEGKPVEFRNVFIEPLP
jgi:hypothetical protein